MNMSKKIVCVIPGRLESTRFPRKILADLEGKPLIERVFEAASGVKCFDKVVIALNSKEAVLAVQAYGLDAILTEGTLSGTDCLVKIASSGVISGDIWVNWQGDEPFISSAIIEDLLPSNLGSGVDVWTLKKKIIDKERIESPHVVKVVTDLNGKALYFSRSTIPYGVGPYFKHIGLYAYTKEALQKIGSMPLSSLEKSEKLEQLRFLENGMHIQVHETAHETIGIDLPEHLEKARTFIKARNRLN